MAVALETVVKQLEDSGIVAAGKLENFVPPKAHPQSVEELVAELVKQNHLTRFQAQHVAAGKVRALILGNYTVLDKIGAGGMGQVFKAEHRRMERIVAIKMLPPATTKDPAALARFQREVKAASKLLHPNIVSAFDADEVHGAHFLVMEYVDGKDLSALVKKNGPFSVAKAVNYVTQAARGLEFAHGVGVIHRDIKPANLLLDKKGTVKILDMGLARIETHGGDAATQAELTGTGAVMGTVDYMAPEQALSTKRADARADIYSLGCSLHYLVAGKAMYGGETLMAKLLAHREQPIPSLHDAQSDVPEQVEAVFRKMVAKDLHDRYQSMSEVVAALEGCGIGREVSINTQQSLGPTAEKLELSILSNATLNKAYKKRARAAGRGGLGNKRPLWIGAGAAGFFALLLGVIVIIRNEKGEEIARIEYPHGASVEVRNLPAGSGPTSRDRKGAAPAAGTQSTAPDPARTTRPITTFKDPTFQAWMKTVAAMPAEKQVEAVATKLVELNPGFDGKMTGIDGEATPKIVNGVVRGVSLYTDDVTDISPVRALVGLVVLKCFGTFGHPGKLSDLSPLRGMQLANLTCGNTQVSDLSPLRGIKLKALGFNGTQVSDISPLQGMPLTELYFYDTPVSDLSPLQGMNLTKAVFTPKNITKGLDVIRQMKSLSVIGAGFEGKDRFPSDEFWKMYDAGEFGKPAAPAKLAYLDPAFQQWMKTVAAMPAEKQVEAIAKKLQESNPGFDGKVTGYSGAGAPELNGDVVTEIGLVTDSVMDISPVRALTGLKVLSCAGSGGRKGTLSDLSPLQGMGLTMLSFSNAQASDLSPLKSMPLTKLYFYNTQISDLSPLEVMPLTELNCGGTKVSNLSPLRGMKLTYLDCADPHVFDLSPLEGMPLETFRFTPKNITRGLDVIRQMRSLTTIGIDGINK